MLYRQYFNRQLEAHLLTAASGSLSHLQPEGQPFQRREAGISCSRVTAVTGTGLFAHSIPMHELQVQSVQASRSQQVRQPTCGCHEKR